MRILLLTHSFNSLTQRLFIELTRLGHELSVEFDINDSVTIEAVRTFDPRLIIAPFLKRRIPEEVWSRVLCWVVHPGIKGDRGPSALDWAILNGESEWGVTLLQAAEEMDAGDIWASRTFPMREASKGSIYRNEVTEAAVACVCEALEKLQDKSFIPEPLDYSRSDVRGIARPPVKQCDRRIDWKHDSMETVLRKIRSADGFPGVLDNVLGVDCYLYNASAEKEFGGKPGEILGRRNGALLRACREGSVWIGHLRKKDGFKVPAATGLQNELRGLAELQQERPGDSEIAAEVRGDIGYLSFDFYNGAMSSAQCVRLRDAFRGLRRRQCKIIVLMGGRDFWSNGINLNTIENDEHPADESWRNINAMNDLVAEIIGCTDRLVISALGGNTAAGGVFLGLAADEIWARKGIVLNPHYKNMGNLYGSEYWTYLLPKRRLSGSSGIMGSRLPIGAVEAKTAGLIDRLLGTDHQSFIAEVERSAEELAACPNFAQRLECKQQSRELDERQKPLAAYREEELNKMRLNFYGFDPSYHVARHNFVWKSPLCRTPLHLARHRTLAFLTRQ